MNTTFVFDIETIGEKFDEMDELTKSVLTQWIKDESKTEDEYASELETLKSRLGFSPLFGEIVAIGIMNVSDKTGAVYFQSPEKPFETQEVSGVKLQAMSEKEMLEKFWEVAKHAGMFVGFNSRTFDAPFLNVRSAVHGIRPSVDLMDGRYLYQQKYGPKHIDLLDQLSYYGTVRRKGNLHSWCRAFDIKSPKSEGVTGDDVGRLFDEKKFEDIARYNIQDLYATRELFLRWHEYLDFQLPR